MTGEAVLIAALTGRALAASARRAGLAPLVVDAFGDEDTRACAAHFCHLPEVTRTGFRAKPLLAALEQLDGAAVQRPIGLVLGSGFEDTPKLVATLARHFPLFGNDAEAIARAKHPSSFFALLDRLAIPHPETQLAPPPAPEGWLSKRIGGSGGAHVLPCAAARTTAGRYYQRRIEGQPISLLAVAARTAGRYYQRRIEGQPISLLAVAARDEIHVVGFSRQWTAGGDVRPYRYGGAAGPVSLGSTIEERLRQAAEGVSAALRLAGLVSFDFLLADGAFWLLEVNPRPGATLDIFDDESGALFRAHLAAFRGERVVLPAPAERPRAAAVLYAEAGPVEVPPQVAWPAWSADRPAPGTRIARHRPVATVFTEGANTMAAEQNCRRCLDELTHMLYARALNRERSNAEVHRPGPERLGTSRQAG